MYRAMSWMNATQLYVAAFHSGEVSCRCFMYAKTRWASASSYRRDNWRSDLFVEIAMLLPVSDGTGKTWPDDVGNEALYYST